MTADVTVDPVDPVDKETFSSATADMIAEIPIDVTPVKAGDPVQWTEVPAESQKDFEQVEPVVAVAIVEIDGKPLAHLIQEEADGKFSPSGIMRNAPTAFETADAAMAFVQEFYDRQRRRSEWEEYMQTHEPPKE